MASPADPTGWPASGPPLATCAASRFARNNVCMCTHTFVHVNAPKWIAVMRAISSTASSATQRSTAAVSSVDSASKARLSTQPIATGMMKNSTNSAHPNQNVRRSCWLHAPRQPPHTHWCTIMSWAVAIEFESMVHL